MQEVEHVSPEMPGLPWIELDFHGVPRNLNAVRIKPGLRRPPRLVYGVMLQKFSALRPLDRELERAGIDPLAPGDDDECVSRREFGRL